MITSRLTAWYADEDKYDYTSLHGSAPNVWTPELLLVKTKVEELAGVKFNSVLLNYYHVGNDSIAWHSDNEKALGKCPVITSVRYGLLISVTMRIMQINIHSGWRVGR